MLVGTYSGQLLLQSSSASKWYINIPIPEIQALRNIVSNHPHQIEWQADKRDHNNPIAAIVHELINLIPNEALGQRYKVTILITDLVPAQSWWYISCSSCWKKTFPHGDGYKCRRCNATAAEPRYRINVYTADPENNEDNKDIRLEFMFFGDIAQELIGRPPMLLVVTTEGQTDYVPPEIKAIVGQKYEVIAQMSEGSLQSDVPTFHVRLIVLQPNQNKLLLSNKAETSSSAPMEIQAITHHEEQLLPISSASLTTTALCTQVVTPFTATTPATSEIASPLRFDKRTHETLITTEAKPTASSTESETRAIQSTKKKHGHKTTIPRCKTMKHTTKYLLIHFSALFLAVTEKIIIYQILTAISIFVFPGRLHTLLTTNNMSPSHVSNLQCLTQISLQNTPRLVKSALQPEVFHDDETYFVVQNVISYAVPTTKTAITTDYFATVNSVLTTTNIFARPFAFLMILDVFQFPHSSRY